LTPWIPSPVKLSPQQVTQKIWWLRPPQQLLQMAPNLPERHSTEQTGEGHASRGTSPATLSINQHSPWADWPPQKKP
jgi:hypothetical protein